MVSARERQWARFTDTAGAVTCNAEMRLEDIRAHCQLDATGANLLKTAMQRLGLSARAYHRVLRVARTIADLAEAIQYQPRGEG